MNSTDLETPPSRTLIPEVGEDKNVEGERQITDDKNVASSSQMEETPKTDEEWVSQRDSVNKEDVPDGKNTKEDIFHGEVGPATAQTAPLKDNPLNESDLLLILSGNSTETQANSNSKPIAEQSHQKQEDNSSDVLSALELILKTEAEKFAENQDKNEAGPKNLAEEETKETLLSSNQVTQQEKSQESVTNQKDTYTDKQAMHISDEADAIQTITDTVSIETQSEEVETLVAVRADHVVSETATPHDTSDDNSSHGFSQAGPSVSRSDAHLEAQQTLVAMALNANPKPSGASVEVRPIGYENIAKGPFSKLKDLANYVQENLATTAEDTYAEVNTVSYANNIALEENESNTGSDKEPDEVVVDVDNFVKLLMKKLGKAKEKEQAMTQELEETRNHLFEVSSQLSVKENQNKRLRGRIERLEEAMREAGLEPLKEESIDYEDMTELVALEEIHTVTDTKSRKRGRASRTKNQNDDQNDPLYSPAHEIPGGAKKGSRKRKPTEISKLDDLYNRYNPLIPSALKECQRRGSPVPDNARRAFIREALASLHSTLGKEELVREELETAARKICTLVPILCDKKGKGGYSKDKPFKAWASIERMLHKRYYNTRPVTAKRVKVDQEIEDYDSDTWSPKRNPKRSTRKAKPKRVLQISKRSKASTSKAKATKKLAQTRKNLLKKHKQMILEDIAKISMLRLEAGDDSDSSSKRKTRTKAETVKTEPVETEVIGIEAEETVVEEPSTEEIPANTNEY